MNAPLATRDAARDALRIYVMRMGLSLSEFASRTGFAHHSLRQFVSTSRYGAGEGQFTAEALMNYMEANPWEPPELPGHLYETEATREMDSLISYCRGGRWATLYGPAGAQKSFLLEYRAAQAARDPEPGFVWLPIPGRMTPCGILRLIATGIAAPYAQSAEGLRQSILHRLRARNTVLVIAFDEADLLYKDVDTLEVIRRLGDALRGRLGIIVAGNEQIQILFRPRGDRYFEQWRSRIQQKEVHILALRGKRLGILLGWNSAT